MIRPSYRAFYGPAWRAFRLALIASHGAWCRDCGLAIERYVQCSHETHDPKNSSIVIRCVSCHTRRDTRHRLAVMRRRRAEAAGQLWLMPEIKWAASPAWAIPPGAIVAVQWELFK